MNKTTDSGLSVGLWLLLFLIACACYLTGLDSLYLPSNGDEMVYSRIARLTAGSGQWLPLVSDLDQMRNTKPPLLFWQAMVAGDWGAQWDLWRLRLPAVLYSLGLAAVLMAITWHICRPQRRRPSEVALISACVYLAFFSSFRYGRPYLTSAAETFWLTLPLWWVIWRRASLPGWGAFAGFGLLWGVGLLYKSFALVLPTAAGLWCVLLALHAKGSGRDWLALALRLALNITFSTVLAVAVFGLWFALDPDPAAVWQEFVVGENGGKLATTALPLSAKLVAVTVQALAWLENAGPLAFVMLGLMGLGIWQIRKGVHGLLAGDRLSLALAAWAVVWLVVFCLPSQRSARYVIPAMPALAVLIALHWQRIPRTWFTASIVLCLPVMLLLTRIGQALYTLSVASAMEWITVAVIGCLGATAALAGLVRQRWTRFGSVVVALSLYALVNAALAPLSGPAGHFDLKPQALTDHAKLAVPSSFNAQYERYQFLLPNASQLQVVPYTTTAATSDAAKLADLLAHHDAVIWQSQGEASAPACIQAPDPTCRLLSERWDIKSRHQSGEIRFDNLFQPAQWLLRREWLLSPN